MGVGLHFMKRYRRFTGRMSLLVGAVCAALLVPVAPVGAIAGFGDVENDRYYAAPVQWAVDEEITGIDGACFSPEAIVTRGEASLWLWRMTKPETVDGSHGFTDVAASELQQPVAWMSQQGITTGTSATTFSPQQSLTRAQIAAFLWRLAEKPEVGSHNFADVTATWQQQPVAWMSQQGITTGTSPTKFSPNTPLTRAQFVTFLYRYNNEPSVTIDPGTPPCDTDEPADSDQPGDTDRTASDDDSDDALLAVDPAIRIGKLDNGLTYYLRSNDSPGDGLALRLAVNAGSLNEAGAGSGVAHFLEHMLFNGTEKFPKNELSKVLQGIGVEFGPDINAYTSYDETVYKLDLRADDAQAVNTAFEVLSQWAHAATIDPEDVEAERGIVRDEYRLRHETGTGIVAAAFPRLYDAGTPYEGRLPIGTVEGIAGISAQDLRDFYEKWYVPSNMAVVAVGDLPLDRLESLVKDHFDAIPAGERPTAPETGSALDPEPKFAIATSPGQGRSYLSLDIRLPSRDQATVAGDRQWWIERLIQIMLGNRLQDAYEQGYLSQTDPTHWSTFVHTRGLRYYGTNLRANDYETALDDFWSLMLTLKAHGFGEEDLARAVTAIKRDLEFAVQSVPTTQDVSYAVSYVSHFLSGADIGTAETRLARVSALLEEVTPAELTARFREIMDQSGLLVLGVAAEPGDLPTIEELTAVVAGAEAGELPPLIVDAEELLAEPTPVEEVYSGELDLLEDAYEWMFPNGARVMFVPSDIADNQVNFQAVSLGGWSAMEPTDRVLTGRLAPRAVRQSGLGALSPAQLARYLDGRTASAQPFIGETTQGVTGAASTADIETMFQLMHLLFTEPRVDDRAFAEVASIGDIILSLSQVDPDWQAFVAYVKARYGDAFDWFNPVASRETLDGLTAESLLSRYKQRFASVDDLVVVVVGDVDRATVERLARTYVGTLPTAEKDTYVNRRTVEPAGIVRQEVELGADSQATRLQVYHEALMSLSPAVEVASEVLKVILNERLLKDVREDIGATYAVSVALARYFTPEQGIRSTLTASGAPGRMDEIETEVFRILDDLVAGNLGAEEFRGAVAVVAANYELAANADLMRPLLQRLFVTDDQLSTPQRLVAEISQLELADVLALAKAIYDPDQHISIVRVLQSPQQ